jgi:hypothetical protein
MSFSKEAAEALSWETAALYEGFLDPDYPIQELGKLHLDLTVNLRALAILSLLLQSDRRRFRNNLSTSGRVRQTYLRRIAEQKLTQDHHFAAGRYNSLLDAIAAGDATLAQRIVSLSPSHFQPVKEYEDDYCFAQIIGQFIQNTPDEKRIINNLSKFEQYADSDNDKRINLCKTLLEKKQFDFNETFSEFLSHREKQILDDKDRGQLEDICVLCQRIIYIDGLAILRIAQMRGLETEKEYLFCPSAVRV